MRLSRLFMIVLLIIAVPSIVYAGQSDTNGTKGTTAEPECDYITQVDYI
jgi:hypothetical protein